MAYPTPSATMEPPHETKPDSFDNMQPRCTDNPFGDFTSNEVQGMNEDSRIRRLARYQREAEHNE